MKYNEWLLKGINTLVQFGQKNTKILGTPNDLKIVKPDSTDSNYVLSDLDLDKINIITTSTNEIKVKVFNNTGSLIPKERILTISGFNSSELKPYVKILDSQTDIPLGISFDNIPNNSVGECIIYGVLNTTLDTSSLSIGDLVFINNVPEISFINSSIKIGKVVSLSGDIFFQFISPITQGSAGGGGVERAELPLANNGSFNLTDTVIFNPTSGGIYDIHIKDYDDIYARVNVKLSPLYFIINTVSGTPIYDEDEDGFLCVYIDGSNLVIKNRLGNTRTIIIHRFI